MRWNYLFVNLAYILIIVLAAIFIMGIMASDKNTPVKKQEYGEVRMEGQIAEHKLTGKKCLVRNYGYRPKGVFQVTDYWKIECVFEDGSTKWVYKSEYKVKY